jgi:hypothetical protein
MGMGMESHINVTSLEPAVDLNHHTSNNSGVGSLKASSSKDTCALVVPQRLRSLFHAVLGLANFCHDSMPSLADVGENDAEMEEDWSMVMITLKWKRIGPWILILKPSGSNPSLAGTMGPSR